MEQQQSWVKVPSGSDFPISNLPYGIFSKNGDSPRPGVAIGDHILDLSVAAQLGAFDGLSAKSVVFQQTTLNDLIANGRKFWTELRKRLGEILAKGSEWESKSAELLVAQSDAQMHMPVLVRDYTDFYSSIEHATNLGKMFRDPANALLPNWRHLPVGYHGRASSIVISGTDVTRPMGQTKGNDDDAPSYGVSQRLDFELEMAHIIGKKTELGERVHTADAEDHVFGFLVFNDWSARDIQKWEYVPLGPFLGKSFASSVSPWIVTLDALEDFRVPGPTQEPAVLSYLKYEGNKNYDLQLEVIIQPEGGEENVVSRSNFKYMYWNIAQQIAHHTVNGCNLNVGDMMASGTISGKDASSYGSMLEISWAGKNPLKLSDGTERKFLKDGDTVIMRAFAEKGDKRIGFGEVRSKVLPAKTSA